MTYWHKIKKVIIKIILLIINIEMAYVYCALCVNYYCFKLSGWILLNIRLNVQFKYPVTFLLLNKTVEITGNL